MKTIVGLFDRLEDAEAAVRDLEAVGLGKQQISVIAQRDAAGEGEGTATGAAIGAGLGLLAGLAAVTIPGIGIVAAVGPIIAGGIIGAVAGGLVGSLVDMGVPADEAEYYTEGVRRGGTLLTVSTADSDAPRAIEIISRHNPVNMQERVAQWRQSGWTPGRPDVSGHTTLGDAASMPPPLR